MFSSGFSPGCRRRGYESTCGESLNLFLIAYVNICFVFIFGDESLKRVQDAGNADSEKRGN